MKDDVQAAYAEHQKDPDGWHANYPEGERCVFCGDAIGAGMPALTEIELRKLGALYTALANKPEAEGHR